MNEVNKTIWKDIARTIQPKYNDVSAYIIGFIEEPDCTGFSIWTTKNKISVSSYWKADKIVSSLSEFTDRE
jgi:hypothetical protein